MISAATVQISRSGLHVRAGALELDRMRAQFDDHHYVILPHLIEPELLNLIQQHMQSGAFFKKTNELVGDELRLRSDAVSGALEFLTNDPALFDLVERATGCPHIGCFRARVYRHVADEHHASDWHEDLVGGRMLTMSINLSGGTYQGGRLQMRNAHTHDVLADVANTGAGDALVFRIDRSLQHRVTPTIGDVPRTAYAGWFLGQPEFSSELRRRLAGISS